MKIREIDAESRVEKAAGMLKMRTWGRRSSAGDCRYSRDYFTGSKGP